MSCSERISYASRPAPGWLLTTLMNTSRMTAGSIHVSQDHMLSISFLCPRCVNADVRHQETNHPFSCSHPYLNALAMAVRCAVSQRTCPACDALSYKAVDRLVVSQANVSGIWYVPCVTRPLTMSRVTAVKQSHGRLLLCPSRTGKPPHYKGVAQMLIGHHP